LLRRYPAARPPLSRATQGLGAALLLPTTLAIIIATFEEGRERTRAIGLWTAIGALALAFGPLIGGFISQNFRWGWIFFINVPAGLITFAMAVAWISESRGRSSATSTSPAWPPPVSCCSH
jgi:MFS family permease